MSKIVMRKMLESDLTVVSELAVLANPHFTKEKCAGLILDELKKNPDLSLVAVVGEKVVGYALADVRNHEGGA